MLKFSIHLGRMTAPKVVASAISLARPWLPPCWPCTEAFLTFDEKDSTSIPAAIQLALRLAGLGPSLTFVWSQGSAAKLFDPDKGRNNSVIAGALTDRVTFPRNSISGIGAHRPPIV